MNSAERFKVEVLFSSGAGHNPYDFPSRSDHFLPVAPRHPLHKSAPAADHNF